MHEAEKGQFPANDREFRKWIKFFTAEQLAALDETALEQFYQRAQVAYDNSSSPISRAERETLYALQEKLFGGVDSKLTNSLEHIGKTLVKKPDKRKKAMDYNLPGSGAVIIKQWKGKRLEVKISESGFKYEGRTYKSLSRLAKEIAGYAVSGPIFFGLRTAKARVAA